ncbi:MAG: DMT family transporter [Pseudomonadota bacterium]|nr:DMT family transporter [Pseudomonadota bacterium]
MKSPEPSRSAAASPLRERDRRGRGATQTYAVLAFTMACWSGNAVAARLAVGEVSPMVIISVRWATVSILLISLVPRRLPQAWPELRRNARRVILMGMMGFSLFNALFYVAAHHTTAVNMAILQGGVPVFVVLGSIAVHRARVGALQALGIAATLIGVAVVATQGHLGTLAAFRLNFGDALLLFACLLQAGYTLSLRDRPNVSSLVLFSALALVAFLTSLPLLAFEIAAGTVLWPTATGWSLLLFIALFPSFLAQLGYMRGVQMIGPGRAGLFNNLVPIFGAFLAVALLGEAFALYHLGALVLVIGGILAAEAAGRRSAGAGAADRKD